MRRELAFSSFVLFTGRRRRVRHAHPVDAPTRMGIGFIPILLIFWPFLGAGARRWPWGGAKDQGFGRIASPLPERIGAGITGESSGESGDESAPYGGKCCAKESCGKFAHNLSTADSVFRRGGNSWSNRANPRPLVSIPQRLKNRALRQPYFLSEETPCDHWGNLRGAEILGQQGVSQAACSVEAPTAELLVLSSDHHQPCGRKTEPAERHDILGECQATSGLPGQASSQAADFGRRYNAMCGWPAHVGRPVASAMPGLLPWRDRMRLA